MAYIISTLPSHAPLPANLINWIALPMVAYNKENGASGMRLLILRTLSSWGANKSMIRLFFFSQIFESCYAQGAYTKRGKCGIVRRSNHVTLLKHLWSIIYPLFLVLSRLIGGYCRHEWLLEENITQRQNPKLKLWLSSSQNKDLELLSLKTLTVVNGLLMSGVTLF